jgi:aminoglycoside 3-N-acetyltransferase I
MEGRTVNADQAPVGEIMIEIRRMTIGDEALIGAASDLFDGPVQMRATERFLAEPGHHLFFGLDDGRAVGFVSGVEVTHPDKGTEMFLYELSVGEADRRRGVGRALVGALRDHARSLGCYGMWVLTDDFNEAALATYRGAGADAPEPTVLLNWDFRANGDRMTQ